MEDLNKTQNDLNELLGHLEDLKNKLGTNDLSQVSHKMSDEDREEYLYILQRVQELERQYIDQVKYL